MPTLALPSLLDRLEEARVHCRAMIVVAHPDDETLGAGALLARLDHAFVVHLADGAPAAPERQAYADRRRREVLAALAIAHIPESQTRSLGLVDQQAVYSLAWAAREIAALLLWEVPDLVITHAYEGGHPDHDAAAFVCRAAFQLCERAGGPVPMGLIEMPFYHHEQSRPVIARFLAPDRDAREIQLDDFQQQKKKRMLAELHSQAHVVAAFPTDVERFRTAPLYDFSSPPHPGVLHYEEEPWGVSWPCFRDRAHVAALELELGGALCR
jgi:N-acetylglucosamine malate deacetylase 2